MNRSPTTPQTVSQNTLAHYNREAESFWEGTKDHNVAQNYKALLSNIVGRAPFTLLDFGCGPGRDLRYFTSLGHLAVGLDGAERFVEMARINSGCEVLHQDFLALELPVSRFDGIFANATLFHVPSADLPRVLRKLHDALKRGGVLFCSNPRGSNEEGWNGDRYGCYHDLDGWRGYLTAAGFMEICHYYRPEGLPRSQQPWLAMVMRKPPLAVAG